MTDQQINEAIAVACGWKYEPRQLKVANIPIEDSFPWINPQNERCRGPHVPNYCKDLNAMHEIEGSFDYNKQLLFMSFLNSLVAATETEEDHDKMRFLWHATARQRAEAFLRTISKWEESK